MRYRLMSVLLILISIIMLLLNVYLVRFSYSRDTTTALLGFPAYLEINTTDPAVSHTVVYSGKMLLLCVGIGIAIFAAGYSWGKKLKPFNVGLLAIFICVVAVLMRNNSSSYPIFTARMNPEHVDCFRTGETNNRYTVVSEIQNLEYVEKAWSEAHNLYFIGNHLSGAIWLGGTNSLFESYGLALDEIPETLTEDEIYRDINLIMEKTKL